MSDHDPINELTDVVDLFGAGAGRAEPCPVADDGREGAAQTGTTPAETRMDTGSQPLLAVADDGLPKLPKHFALFNIDGPDGYRIKGYTAEQVRQAMREAYEAGRRKGWFDGAGDAAELAAEALQPSAGDSVDTPEFREMLDDYDDAASYGSLKHARAGLIAHIDAWAARRAAGVPDGWKPVPIEPTPEMIAAMHFKGDIDIAIGHAHFYQDAAEDYAAMLAAAPQPPKATP